MNRIIRYVLWTFLITCPIVWPWTITNIRNFQEVYFQYMAMILIVMFCRNPWIIAFFVWNIILFFMNGFDVGQGQIANIFFGILLFMVSRQFFKHNKVRELRVILGVTALTIVWMILQMFGIDPLYYGTDMAGNLNTTWYWNDPVGLFGFKAANGQFLALSMPLMASVAWWAGPLLYIPIWTTMSSVSILSGTVGLLFYYYFRNRRVFIVMAVVGSILSIFYIGFKDYSFSSDMWKSRFAVWHSGVAKSMRFPIGYGPDSWRSYTKFKNFKFFGDGDFNAWIVTESPDSSTPSTASYYTPNFYERTHPKKPLNLSEFPSILWDNPHNLLVTILFEYGLVGILLLVGFIRELYLRFRFSLQTEELVLVTSILLVYATASLTHFPLHLARLGFMFPIVLGAFYAKSEKIGN